MNSQPDPAEYRKLSSVDELLRDKRTSSLLAAYPRKIVADALRQAIADARAAVARGAKAPGSDALLEAAAVIAESASRMSLRRAVNATGVIVHTGLGRALLAQPAAEALAEIASAHSTLEIDLATGKRGSRQDHVHDLLMELTGAESALVVNNNAAAVFLAINTLARGMEVIISRGQLVEIGGSFRLPDVIRSAGAKLVEVGTTNRTRIGDYGEAINADTAVILRCHPSNFRMSGFVEEAPLRDLVELAHRASLSVVDDLGSGALVDLTRFGLDYEPTVQDSIRAGADLVCFSGDKLLGGPQAGILVGREDLVAKCRSNPIARALRIDKLSLCALEATLRIYRDADPATGVPVLAAMSRPLDDIRRQARRLTRSVNALGVPGLRAWTTACQSEVGGGSLPGMNLDSFALALQSDALSADDLVERFRGHEPPIFGRIVKDDFLLDLRTVDPQDARHILDCVRKLAEARP